MQRKVVGGGNVLANKPAGASNNKGNEHKRLQWACHCVVGGSGDGKVREREILNLHIWFKSNMCVYVCNYMSNWGKRADK